NKIRQRFNQRFLKGQNWILSLHVPIPQMAWTSFFAAVIARAGRGVKKSHSHSTGPVVAGDLSTKSLNRIENIDYP
ncbi:MAG: hypothetical protein UDQ48_01020, partial [Dialister sp.]|uniref:hypothetical protein n=1 Tax=Dialister sp. TaxID=1955814 RepID=UPI002E778055